MTASDRVLPRWAVVWLYLGNVLAFTDNFLFLQFRPHTLRGGSLAFLWPHMMSYLDVDHAFSDMSNAFIKAQSLITIAVFVPAILALYFHHRKDAPRALLAAFAYGILSAFIVSLIFLVEIMSGFANTGHNSATTIAMLFFLPNSFWVIVPLFIATHAGQRIVAVLSQSRT